MQQKDTEMLEPAKIEIGNKVCFIDCSNNNTRIRSGTITNIVKDRLFINGKEHLHLDFEGIYELSALPKLLKAMQIMNTKNRGKQSVTYILDIN